MTEKRKRAAEEEVERRMERERLAGKAKEVEEEKKREKEVNAEKQARLARWKESSPKMLNIFDHFDELPLVRFWHHQKTEVEDKRQNEVEKQRRNTSRSKLIYKSSNHGTLSYQS